MTDFVICQYQKSDFDELLRMSLALFSNYAPAAIERDLRTILKKDNNLSFLAKTPTNTAGFITVSIRTDYVEGASTSPAGYLEAIYVKPEFRTCGLARKLYERGESWIKERGCTEIGSDTWSWNTDAQNFHSRLGFKKEDVLVHYIKTIKK